VVDLRPTSSATPEVDAPQTDIAFASESAVLYEIGLTLLERRRSLILWGVVGGLLTGLVIFLGDRQYAVRTSFVAQGTGGDASQLSGLRGIAGQFGVALPASGNALASPALLGELIASPTILRGLIQDTVQVTSQGRTGRLALLDVLEVDSAAPAIRREEGVRALGRALKVNVAKETGLVSVVVTTREPDASMSIARRLMDELVKFHLNLRRDQASAERRFVENRLTAQRKELEASEARLAVFLLRNRDYSNSPDLRFQHDRMQRDVDLQQQVLSGLAQSREEALIREVRDIPNVAVVEAPLLPARPEPRGLIRRGIFGGLVGMAVGAFVIAVTAAWERLARGGDTPAARFFRSLGDLVPGRRRRAAA
jgi:uncharacterized protein involved in exopolysaccharide biosynthesis